MSAPVFLDHSIVGASQLTNFDFNKDREWAGCRICGAIFQSRLNSNAVATVQHLADPELAIRAHQETLLWRENHNKLHTQAQHDALAASGLTLTPEAAHKLAPYGVAPVADALNDEVKHALGTAPRAPSDNPETPLTKGISVPMPEVRVEVETPDAPDSPAVPAAPTEPEPEFPMPEPEPDTGTPDTPDTEDGS